MSNIRELLKIPEQARVVNKKKLVYIGRPTKWGNYYSHLGVAGTTLVKNRFEAVLRFAKGLVKDKQLVKDARKELKGKTLVCYCDPELCHGHVWALVVGGTDPEIVVERLEAAREELK
jgi:hypothetical protein